MTRRPLALLPAAALAALLLTGCGSHAGAAATPPATSPAASDLAHMQKLVDDADSAAAAADSNASTDN